MLRSLLLSFLALLILTGGFVVYWRLQPRLRLQTDGWVARVPTTMGVPSSITQMKIGPGTSQWINTFDDHGRLASQFTAAEFTPQKNGTFSVVHPVNVFYLADGQFMVVTGDSGLVYVDAPSGGTAGKAPLQAGMQPPNRGTLQKVQVKLFPRQNADQPTLWMNVNNLTFDSTTSRLYTEKFTDAAGTTVEAEDVPVTIRGDEYEFDGTGLKVSWNGIDHHLQLLEVAHGGRLEIKNPSKISMPGPARPTAQPVGNAGEDHPLPEALASADPAAAGLALGKPNSTVPPIAYHAVFNDAVRVLQGDRTVAIADVMTVDFQPASEKPKPVANDGAKAGDRSATSAPSENDTAAPPAAQRLADQPIASNGVTAPVTKPAATQPAVVPVTIYWTGKLRITPLATEPVMPISPGQLAMKMVGSPVVLTPEGAEIHAASAIYRSPDGALQLQNSTAFPFVEVKQIKGMTFTTEQMVYDPASSHAIFIGRSDLHLPMEGVKNQALVASWLDKGIVHFQGKGGQPNTADSVDLTGHVDVHHPQFTLKSSELVLALDKTAAAAPAGKSAVTLKRATAHGTVQCRLLQPGKADQGIDGDDLVLGTAAGPGGKTVPRTVVADGHVKAFDTDQRLQADHLEAFLRPAVVVAKQPPDANGTGAVELESLYARTNVHSIMKNGATADADELHVVTRDKKTEVELHGAPATVADTMGSTLTGPVIHISPEASMLVVDGSGAIHAVRQTAPGQAAHPMTVTWTDSMTVNGAANTVDAVGGVTVRTTDAIGTVNTVVGDTAHLTLADAKPVKGKHAATTQTDADFGGKELNELILAGNVHGESLLNAADGLIARRDELWTSKIIYNAVTGRTELPGAGRLLVEDHREAAAGGAANGRGAMALRWKDSLVDDAVRHVIVVTGDTHADFLQEQKDAQPMHMRSQKLTINLIPPPATATVNNDADATSKIQVARVFAEGAADFKAKGFDISGHSMDYEPATELLTIAGSNEEPGNLTNDDGSAPQGFDEMIWDTKSQQIKSVSNVRGGIGR